MRNRYLLGLCLSTSLTTPAAAESWYEIGTTDTSIDFADADSVRRNHNGTSVMLFRGMDSTEAPFVKVAVDLDCASNRFRVTSTQSYNSSRQYLSTDSSVSAWDQIAADSIAETAKEFACDGLWRSTPVSDPFAEADEYWYYYYYYEDTPTTNAPRAPSH